MTSRICKCSAIQYLGFTIALTASPIISRVFMHEDAVHCTEVPGNHGDSFPDRPYIDDTSPENAP